MEFVRRHRVMSVVAMLGFVWLAVRFVVFGRDLPNLAADTPGGLTATIQLINAAFVALGALIAAGSRRLAELGGQLQSAPLTRVQLFMGARGVPGVVRLIIPAFAVTLVVGLPIFTTAGMSNVGLWELAFFGALVTAGVTGLGLGEFVSAKRQRASLAWLSLLVGGHASYVLATRLRFNSWVWLTMPIGIDGATPSVGWMLPLLGVTGSLTAAAWIGVGSMDRRDAIAVNGDAPRDLWTPRLRVAIFRWHRAVMRRAQRLRLRVLLVAASSMALAGLLWRYQSPYQAAIGAIATLLLVSVLTEAFDPVSLEVRRSSWLLRTLPFSSSHLRMSLWLSLSTLGVALATIGAIWLAASYDSAGEWAVYLVFLFVTPPLAALLSLVFARRSPTIGADLLRGTLVLLGSIGVAAVAYPIGNWTPWAVPLVIAVPLGLIATIVSRVRI